MVQNLRLVGPLTLTSANSDVTSNFTLPASVDDFGAAIDATSTNTARMHSNGNNWLTPAVTGSTSTLNTTGTPPKQTQYQGNFYNWYAATAGTGTYAMSTDGQNSTRSICPKGWRLPTIKVGTTSDSNEFQKLYSTYSRDTFLTVAAIVYSGFRSGTTDRNVGSEALLSSSTTKDNLIMYHYTISINSAWSSNSNKIYGFPIRCLAR